ncbi:hypothetical protein MPTK1_4g17740 [Marchantia polymorpha subsp. ruderalis]|uniref:Uncharacterized protein n=2 Tax=Marchantia polymorpha TaxID=3197 RepID=A0AAF6BAY5_MARPO|nr:hypothetical protein MARPO_0041s0055 [Marchantia polymorpha]BBN09169.1 hypothetical protein Mp_4g17740 [Marchantia polymorpha subsp. ruderalis]|eukprot:PTQ40157.1 hypothetical protein MARPO_0041s0055 [Marchantia polymorpha]
MSIPAARRYGHVGLGSFKEPRRLRGSSSIRLGTGLVWHQWLLLVIIPSRLTRRSFGEELAWNVWCQMAALAVWR